MRLGIAVRAILSLGIATCVVALAGSPATRAQSLFPNPFSNAQDVAVRAALSSFGKTIGAQLPVVVSPSDAYPTSQLPGPPFATPRNPDITASLRRSQDGTVPLPPGDYAFTVDVFCMQVHAGSPSGHRYLVAALRGSAADIFRALNARAPSYQIEHHALQVLSWEIQAGLAYSEMQAPQRAIVDRVIPDFRSHLSADVYLRIRAQYEQVAGKVPGMPSFESALGRLGPAGQAVLQMETLREEMAQPPPTFAELAHELVPLIPLERGGSGETPWSRYSDQVYVRFVTSGNYATPGTYQVRVLNPQHLSSTRMIGLGPPGSGAPVPFSNVVNNPGTPSVQPLTQAPQPGNGPAPTPTPNATITSQTVATAPADRTRLTVGVGEQVKLTFSGADANWTISGGEGTVTPSGKTSIYSASITPAHETIVAVDTATSATASITFDVIAPTGLYFERIPSTEIHHHQGWPDIGFEANVYLQPDTVSFEYIGVREQDAIYSASGYYSWMNGLSHKPVENPEVVSSLVPGKGWRLAQPDDVWSGRQPATPPFAPGHETVDIPWEYDAASNEKAGPFYLFAHVTQVCELKNDRSTIIATKQTSGATTGIATITLSVSSPDYH